MPLRLTLEIVPGGIEVHKRVIGTIDIINVAPVETPALGDYEVIWKGASGHPLVSFGVLIRGYRRSRGAWRLAHLVLGKTLVRHNKLLASASAQLPTWHMARSRQK